ncbi:TPA: hypothetical protein N0F65_009344 [Lagenidium giganteum]|uniref:IgA peptidase M64 n=1 Tax=Lagenidium giganteum TaxID=4803 RepID=A0AAV2YIS4_9STRA|nr:TPA: hypothetical protein N0F65_009344 [Lagenidium giganteum]
MGVKMTTRTFLSVLLPLATLAAQVTNQETFATKVLVDQSSSTIKCTVIKPLQPAQVHRLVASPDDVVDQTATRRNRKDLSEFNIEFGTQVLHEFIGGSKAAVEKAVAEHCPNGVESTQSERDLQELEADKTVIKKLVDSGDPKNRIDVVFMGDGYTANEQTKFFDDMARLTHDMFTGDTFAQYLPLFNIWGVFTPSSDSGIGVGGRPKNTPFGLYRDGTELRGIYCSKPDAARRACAAVGQLACDFPSLIANDDYYGGLGGEFVIGTRSPTTGTIVLRHEMGHNFGRVGEEYDGGQVYRGANSAASLSQVSWKHWLTNPSGTVREEKASLTFTDHMWVDLKQGPYKITFTASGKYRRWMMVLSASGADTDGSLEITLDGQPLAWTSSGVKDRSFYTWTNTTHGLSAGQHKIVVTGHGPFDGKIIQQLCSVDMNEYMDEGEFQMGDEVISAYPTWDGNNRKTFRPNNEKCLMRNMISTKFCSVCLENMWLMFLERVQLIDDVVVSGTTAKVKVIPLAQFRQAKHDRFLQESATLVSQERFTVSWLRDGVEVIDFQNQFEVDLAKASGGSSGQWTVRVKFLTPAVRKDPKNLLQSEKTFKV